MLGKVSHPKTRAHREPPPWVRSCVKLAVGLLFLSQYSIVHAGPEWEQTKQWIRTQYPTVPHLSTSTLEDLLENSDGNSVLLLDAREPREYEVSHLPGAKLAPTEKLALNEIAKARAGTSVVVYCSVGYRSARLAARLRARGYEVSNLEGSIFEWANSGRAVYRGERRVSGVHPYDKTWGQLLDRDKWAFPN